MRKKRKAIKKVSNKDKGSQNSIIIQINSFKRVVCVIPLLNHPFEDLSKIFYKEKGKRKITHKEREHHTHTHTHLSFANSWKIFSEATEGMHRSVVQSSPVQQMMAGNPNWWNININTMPPQQPSPFFSSPSNFPIPYAAPSSLPFPSWNENQDLPESWSQLLMYINQFLFLFFLPSHTHKVN